MTRLKSLNHLGTILNSYWNNVEIFWGQIWKHFGIILKSFGNSFETFRGKWKSIWETVGIILESIWSPGEPSSDHRGNQAQCAGNHWPPGTQYDFYPDCKNPKGKPGWEKSIEFIKNRLWHRYSSYRPETRTIRRISVRSIWKYYRWLIMNDILENWDFVISFLNHSCDLLTSWTMG